MSIIDDIQSMKEVDKIKKGGTGRLSISQITNLIISLMDAKKNLDHNTFKRVEALFYELRKCKTKIPMDHIGYADSCIRIIKQFDKIAPYEKYSGGNETEFSFLMDEIRAEGKKTHVDIPAKAPLEEAKNSEKIIEDFAEKVIQHSSEKIGKDEAIEFSRIVIEHYSVFGKDGALRAFDSFVNKMLADGPGSLRRIDYFINLLETFKIIKSEERLPLKAKYATKSAHDFAEMSRKMGGSLFSDSPTRNEERSAKENTLVSKDNKLWTIDVDDDIWDNPGDLSSKDVNQANEPTLFDDDYFHISLDPEFVDEEMKKNAQNNEITWVPRKLTKEETNEVNEIIEESYGLLEKHEAAKFVDVFRDYSRNGKEDTLILFDCYFKKMINKYGSNAVYATDILLNIMEERNIISTNEWSQLTNKYNDIIMNLPESSLGPKRLVSVFLQRDLYSKIDATCERLGVPLFAFVRSAINNAINNENVRGLIETDIKNNTEL